MNFGKTTPRRTTLRCKRSKPSHSPEIPNKKKTPSPSSTSSKFCNGDQTVKNDSVTPVKPKSSKRITRRTPSPTTPGCSKYDFKARAFTSTFNDNEDTTFFCSQLSTGPQDCEVVWDCNSPGFSKDDLKKKYLERKDLLSLKTPSPKPISKPLHLLDFPKPRNVSPSDHIKKKNEVSKITAELDALLSNLGSKGSTNQINLPDDDNDMFNDSDVCLPIALCATQPFELKCPEKAPPLEAKKEEKQRAVSPASTVSLLDDDLPEISDTEDSKECAQLWNESTIFENMDISEEKVKTCIGNKDVDEKKSESKYVDEKKSESKATNLNVNKRTDLPDKSMNISTDVFDDDLFNDSVIIATQALEQDFYNKDKVISKVENQNTSNLKNEKPSPSNFSINCNTFYSPNKVGVKSKQRSRQTFQLGNDEKVLIPNNNSNIEENFLNRKKVVPSNTNSMANNSGTQKSSLSKSIMGSQRLVSSPTDQMKNNPLFIDNKPNFVKEISKSSAFNMQNTKGLVGQHKDQLSQQLNGTAKSVSCPSNNNTSFPKKDSIEKQFDKKSFMKSLRIQTSSLALDKKNMKSEAKTPTNSNKTPTNRNKTPTNRSKNSPYNGVKTSSGPVGMPRSKSSTYSSPASSKSSTPIRRINSSDFSANLTSIANGFDMCEDDDYLFECIEDDFLEDSPKESTSNKIWDSLNVKSNASNLKISQNSSLTPKKYTSDQVNQKNGSCSFSSSNMSRNLLKDRTFTVNNSASSIDQQILNMNKLNSSENSKKIPVNSSNLFANSKSFPVSNTSSTTNSEIFPFSNLSSTKNSETFPFSNLSSTKNSETFPFSNISSTKNSETFPFSNVSSTANSQTFPFSNVNSKNFPVSNVNSKKFPVSNVNAKTFPVSNENSKTFPVSNTSSKPFPVSNANSKTFPISNVNSKSFPVSNANSKTFPVSNANSKNFPVSNVNSKPFPVSNVNSKPFPVSNVNSKPSPVSNVNSKPSPVSNVNSKPFPVSNANSKPLPASNVNSKSFPVSNVNVSANQKSRTTKSFLLGTQMNQNQLSSTSSTSDKSVNSSSKSTENVNSKPLPWSSLTSMSSNNNLSNSQSIKYSKEEIERKKEEARKRRAMAQMRKQKVRYEPVV